MQDLLNSIYFWYIISAYAATFVAIGGLVAHNVYKSAKIRIQLESAKIRFSTSSIKSSLD